MQTHPQMTPEEMKALHDGLDDVLDHFPSAIPYNSRLAKAFIASAVGATMAALGIFGSYHYFAAKSGMAKKNSAVHLQP